MLLIKQQIKIFINKLLLKTLMRIILFIMHNIFKKTSTDKNNNYNLFFIKLLYTLKKVLPRIELGSKESESFVLTITP